MGLYAGLKYHDMYYREPQYVKVIMLPLLFIFVLSTTARNNLYGMPFHLKAKGKFDSPVLFVGAHSLTQQDDQIAEYAH